MAKPSARWRGDELLDQVAERDRLEKSGLVVHRRQLGENGPAAFHLLPQEPEVVGQGTVLRHGVIHLLGHEGDRRQGRAELVGRRRREAVELRQVLFPGQDELRRGERLGQLARLLGHPPGVDAREGRAQQDRGPDPVT